MPEEPLAADSAAAFVSVVVVAVCVAVCARGGGGGLGDCVIGAVLAGVEVVVLAVVAAVGWEGEGGLGVEGGGGATVLEAGEGERGPMAVVAGVEGTEGGGGAVLGECLVKEPSSGTEGSMGVFGAAARGGGPPSPLSRRARAGVMLESVTEVLDRVFSRATPFRSKRPRTRAWTLRAWLLQSAKQV